MFNRALINQTITLSSIATNVQNLQTLYTLANHKVEIDVPMIKIQQALSFENCLFVVLPELSLTTTMIFTTEAVRIENSRLEVCLCIWGELRQNNVLGYLGQDGPNSFIENSEFGEFAVNIVGAIRTFPPSIQFSGLINHCRIIAQENLRVSFLQCKFHLVEISGSCDQFQISETLGRELIFSNFVANYMWFQRELVMQVQRVEIDQNTIQKLAEVMKRHGYPEHFVKSLKMFMSVFKANRHGSLFLMANDILCCALRYKNPNLVKNFIIYGVLKNFYSTGRMLLVCLFIVLIFGGLYFQFVPIGHPHQSFHDWLYFSAVTFTTLGYGDITPQGVLRFIAPIEALIGIISVVVTSWIFARQFNDY